MHRKQLRIKMEHVRQSYCKALGVFRSLDFRLHMPQDSRVSQDHSVEQSRYLQKFRFDLEVAIITSSSDEKLARAGPLGATHTINYRKDPDWQDTVMKLTNNDGVDIILETGGAQTLRKSFDCIAFGGTIACIGYLSGKQDDPVDRMNVNVLALRRTVTLRGIINGPRDRFEEVLRFYEAKNIRPVVDKVFSFNEAKEALQYLYSGSHFGKVVIRVKP